MKKAKILLIISITIWFAIILVFIFSLPSTLFKDPYSTAVYDKNNQLLGVKIAEDGQWRFPETQKISPKFEACILNFEDQRFYYHFGIDPIAITRAIKQNISSGKIKSGGSTISMQTIRIARKGKERTYYQKIIEVILAFRLELSYSKKEILQLYASHAPFGGNTVGIEAAAWRYFERSPEQLSWAENAMLAVLPNSPSLINTAKNREILKEKRDFLLKKLYTKNIISEEEYELAILEPIPEHPNPYPMHAYHLVNRAAKEFPNNNSKIETTIDINLQKQINEIVNIYNQRYKANHIYNIACLVLEVESGKTLAYVGNADINSETPEKAIDMIKANRSSGSILKPFLYAAALSAGEILPKTLLRDTPLRIGSFSPENFDKSFDGAVPASEALARSLNIPFVLLLKEYGIAKFIYVLKSLGLKSVNKSSEHYGLSLILGGAETSLWDICSAYASMARSLKNYNKYQSKYSKSDYHEASYIKNAELNEQEDLRDWSFLSASSIWFTFEAMSSVNRPAEEKQWRTFSSKQKISWKTGTSFGFKDAWSVAVTPDYVVGVWVGNASGEGRNGITGLRVAAPVLFDIINILPSYKNWFEIPYDDMILAPVCKQSGYLAGENCCDIDSVWISTRGINTNICPYHQKIYLDQSETFRVNSDCYPVNLMKEKSYFILPPSMEAYFINSNYWYQSLPPFLEDCSQQLNVSEQIELIYPTNLSRVLIPIEMTGDTLQAIFKVSHRNPETKVYWYIDEKYYGFTKDFHEMGFKLKPGNYTLNLMDENGYKISKKFKVISND
ncbi:MAG: penicillin-binding protein 1C [Bacteroidota bacterium]|jgi:penicillin-binding protein 1C|nr:penicillin-binding protein 1C [Bacteroidota bacterium]NLP20180.1 penicillin-binding protein 1C [Bacteroidales bacterium]OQC45024.1 MAG: Penicillin-binding protein 1F [Bacteroidetes bacterium ADurb.Bin028]